MASHAILKPALQPGSPVFVDCRLYRRNLPLVYLQYYRSHLDMFYSKDYEREMLLLRPLFFTSFLLDDFLFAKPGQFGAIVITSASSKTSLGLAFALKHFNRGCRVLGITSNRNALFTKRVGYYDEVFCYEDVESNRFTSDTVVGNNRSVAVVDMSGNRYVFFLLPVSAVHSAPFCL